jgi:hypothetical protein
VERKIVPQSFRRFAVDVQAHFMIRIDDKTTVEKLRRAADGAVSFEVSPLFERLIKMRVEQPKSFAAMSSSMISALGYYEAAKRRAAMLEDNG